MQGLHTGPADSSVETCLAFTLALDDATIPCSETDTHRIFDRTLDTLAVPSLTTFAKLLGRLSWNTYETA